MLKNYLFDSNELGKNMQEDVDMYIKKDRFNDASLLKKLDPLFKNLLCRQNPLSFSF